MIFSCGKNYPMRRSKVFMNFSKRHFAPNLLLLIAMSSVDFIIDSCIAEVNNDPKSSDLSLLEKMKLAKEIFDLKMTMVMQMKQLSAPSLPSLPPSPPAPTAPSPAPSQQINISSV